VLSTIFYSSVVKYQRNKDRCLKYTICKSHVIFQVINFQSSVINTSANCRNSKYFIFCKSTFFHESQNKIRQFFYTELSICSLVINRGCVISEAGNTFLYAIWMKVVLQKVK
jgi:hypothetical protein